jgi:hypothetical protein
MNKIIKMKKNEKLEWPMAIFLIISIILYFFRNKLPIIKDLTFLPESPYLASFTLIIIIFCITLGIFLIIGALSWAICKIFSLK